VSEVEKEAHLRMKQLDMSLQDVNFAVSIGSSCTTECKLLLLAHSESKDDLSFVSNKKNVDKHLEELKKSLGKLTVLLSGISQTLPSHPVPEKTLA